MIVLVGFMGAGKTTVGRLLAAPLGLPFTDTDHVVEARAGRPIPEVFRTDGEDAFRDLEERAVADVLAGPAAVVSLGGGACGRAATRERLRAHTVVHLRVSLEQTRARTAGDANRPLLQRPDLAELHAARQRLYDEVATVAVPTDGRAAEEVARDVLGRIETQRTARDPEDR
ncbi:shikimate kinase [Paenibacillus sp. TRM 82003]|uniref:shikimate kinase n=1 Tax=Kineococcus sp. TRM81007 TaxID=2925831 RepID=UPI001F572557|nr:shikimate kinase [Kineococcus sp. TRM81007]MCI2239016.1 shikimate kinase [Kineococcus sp. TRM81007]MCI3924436.1 shikimate kinase [Paenibacillus sp. TRM 82003]